MTETPGVKELALPCDCHSEIMLISSWEPWGEGEDYIAYVDIYTIPGKNDLKWRIKQAWWTLTGSRKAHRDSVALQKNSLTELRNFLTTVLEYGDASDEASNGSASGSHAGDV